MSISPRRERERQQARAAQATVRAAYADALQNDQQAEYVATLREYRGGAILSQERGLTLEQAAAWLRSQRPTAGKQTVAHVDAYLDGKLLNELVQAIPGNGITSDSTGGVRIDLHDGESDGIEDDIEDAVLLLSWAETSYRVDLAKGSR